MGRECTNALSQTPLWQFALATYFAHKTDLLYWQDNYEANVNDLLLMAFARKTNQSLRCHCWQQPSVLVLRKLIKRVRLLRRKSSGSQTYDGFKQLELELEGVDIQLLQACLVDSGEAVSTAITCYEKHLNIKKGALAPFINSLVN